MTRSLAPLYVLAGMVAGLWGGTLAGSHAAPKNRCESAGLTATDNAGSSLSPLPRGSQEGGILSDLDSIDARVTQLVRVREACESLVRRTDYAARQRPGYERRRAQRGVLAAHLEARAALGEGEVCR